MDPRITLAAEDGTQLHVWPEGDGRFGVSVELPDGRGGISTRGFARSSGLHLADHLKAWAMPEAEPCGEHVDGGE
jgi:hypothetical protein